MIAACVMFSPYGNAVLEKPFARFILADAHGLSEAWLGDAFRYKPISSKAGLCSNSCHQLEGGNF